MAGRFPTAMLKEIELFEPAAVPSSPEVARSFVMLAICDDEISNGFFSFVLAIWSAL
jgi:hypothetical protein